MERSLLARERVVILASLAAITLLAWLHLLGMGSVPSSAVMDGMEGMDGMQGVPAEGMAPALFAMAAAMWVVMMVGMMLPAAAPMILLYATVQRQRGRNGGLMISLFSAGYLLVWGGFALAAAGLQFLLNQAGLLSASLALLNVQVTGIALVLAGLYELSPLKNRCLDQCRAPLTFVMNHWRPGARGALAMGLHHGVICLGCCWMLMLLLFAAGAMNLIWVATLAALVLVQKLLPGGRAVSTATGLALLAIGAVLLVR
jgi:predicted metal-binding membrane protein